MSADPAMQYALCVIGGGAIFWCGWWLFCFIVRNGLDGVRAMSKAINERRWPDVRKIFIGTWK